MNIFAEWLETFFDEVTPMEFYRAVFPAGELERKGERITGKYCAIAVEVTKEKSTNPKKKGKPLIKRYSITDDLEVVENLSRSQNFCLCAPISYAGKARTAENARMLYGIAVDLDHIQIANGKPQGLIDLWNGHVMNVGRLPKPTYIVASGTGVHLYYLLSEPIPLFRNVAKQLQGLKHELTERIWHGTIVDIHHQNEIQQEGIFQGFRMVGTVTKTGERTRAFLTGEPVTLEYLNGFVSDANKVTRYATTKELTKEKAREKYPEWYERRIVKGEPSGVWHTSRAVYDWWKAQILENAKVGHRYWCMMTLAVYARKCGLYDAKHNPNPVTREELERDCWEIAERFERLTDNETNHFDEADVLDALEAYDERWIKYPLHTIESRCGFAIPRNKRNGEKQAEHLEIARAIRDIKQKRKGRKWTDGNGRMRKQGIVEYWQAQHPNGTKMECHKETGISRPTIDRWWK